MNDRGRESLAASIKDDGDCLFQSRVAIGGVRAGVRHTWRYGLVGDGGGYAETIKCAPQHRAPAARVSPLRPVRTGSARTDRAQGEATAPGGVRVSGDADRRHWSIRIS